MRGLCRDLHVRQNDFRSGPQMCTKEFLSSHQGLIYFKNHCLQNAQVKVKKKFKMKIKFCVCQPLEDVSASPFSLECHQQHSNPLVHIR